jgi:hypothetical protein
LQRERFESEKNPFREHRAVDARTGSKPSSLTKNPALSDIRLRHSQGSKFLLHLFREIVGERVFRPIVPVHPADVIIVHAVDRHRALNRQITIASREKNIP